MQLNFQPDQINPANLVKFLLGLLFVTVFRFILRIPNVQPLLAVQMPFSKKFGGLTGAIFGSITIVTYDVFSGHVGPWTVVTSVMYILLGLTAAVYLSDSDNQVGKYACFSVFGTLLYDFTTGPVVGTLIFGQNFAHSFLAQFPFTFYHLAGNLFFALTVSPLVYRWIVKDHRYHPARLI